MQETKLGAHNHGNHTLDIECKSVLSIGVERSFSKNRADLDRLWSAVSSFKPLLLWMDYPTRQDGLLLKHQPFPVRG